MNTSRINMASGGLAIALAVLIDVFQFVLMLVPIVGWFLSSVVSVVSMFLFGIWFSHLGVGLFSEKRILGTLGAMLGEALPLANGFPLWTIRISTVVINEWRSPRV